MIIFVSSNYELILNDVYKTMGIVKNITIIDN